jgi:hypothetical protein
MQIPPTNEIASFWYSQNSSLTIPYDTFVKENRATLEKIKQYEFQKWSQAILETGDLTDALIWLNVRFGIPYIIETLDNVRSRVALLYLWETNWGFLPKHFRIAFIRHPDFMYLKNFDFDIIAELFKQHKKFETVLEHIRMLVDPNSEVNPFLDDYTPLDNLLTLEMDIDEFEWNELTGSGELGITNLSKEMGVDLDWNLDEMGSEEILGFDKETEDHSNLF